MKLPILLAACLLPLPCLAADIFRCTTETGSVEYRDWPCAPGTGGKATIEDDAPSPADQAKALRELEEQSRAFDARMRSRAELAQRRYEAELRERTWVERVTQESVVPEPEPYWGWGYVPLYAVACAGRLADCAQPHYKRQPRVHPAPYRRQVVPQLQKREVTELRAAPPSRGFMR